MATSGVAPGAKPSGPSTLDAIIANTKPVIAAAIRAADAAGPVIASAIAKGQRIWTEIQPYHPEDFFPLIFGLILIFFGGQFPVLIAAIEAFRLCGWDNTRAAISLLWNQYQVAADASRKDDLVDDNNDGVADVKQIDSKALVSRKVQLFLKSTDPNALNTGIQGLAAGCSAVVATLRLHFAQTITLGISLGDIFTRTANKVLKPALERALPKEHHKWIDMSISYACRSVAVTIAWWCTRIISAMHSATRGAQLLLVGALKIAARFNVHIPFDLSSNNPAYPLVCGTVAGVGLYTQIMRGFALPFPLNLLLFPLRIVEWALYYFLVYGN